MNLAPSYKTNFPAVVRHDTRIVVLGSLPGEMSLAMQQYYAHPRNQFWSLMGEVIGRQLVGIPYPERLALLLEHKVGLWDVVARATRKGSLDTALRDIEMHNMEELLAAGPSIRAIGFNGGVAWRQADFFAAREIAAIRLPSSSPAYVRPYQEKLAAWLQLRDYLE